MDQSITNFNPSTRNVFAHCNGFPPPPAGIRGLPSADIEMVSFNVATYTSLRDLLPLYPPAAASHPPSNHSSWSEIPIKNPLVKHAAIAYLQPMSTPSEADGKGILGKIRERCGCGGGATAGVGWCCCCCWWWGVTDVVRMILRVAGLGRGRLNDDGDQAEEEDEDDEDYDKVD